MANLDQGFLAGLPILPREVVFHVGALDAIREMRAGSYEGTGLSVSLHPRAWTRIAKLGGYPTYALRRRDGRAGHFVDQHALSQPQLAALRAAAVATGLLVPGCVWEHRWYDDEWECEFAAVYESESEARAELADPDDPGSGDSVAMLECHLATDALRSLWAAHFTGPLGTHQQEDFAMQVLLEASGAFDGVWHASDLDPSRLSAPAGAIFQSKLAEWQWAEPRSDDWGASLDHQDE
jgi:hypothetical protein